MAYIALVVAFIYPRTRLQIDCFIEWEEQGAEVMELRNKELF